MDLDKKCVYIYGDVFTNGNYTNTVAHGDG